MINTALGYYETLTKFDTPWNHYILDNFLDSKQVNNLVKLQSSEGFIVIDGSKHVNGVMKLRAGENEGHSHKRSLSLALYPDIDLSIEKSVWDKLGSLLPENSFCVSDLVVCDPGYEYGPHKDHVDKLWSIVVFLYPEMSNATVLMGDNDNYELLWRCGRALIFNNKEHGRHYYINKTQYPRITLNIYITNDKNHRFIVQNYKRKKV